jgi:hypothetical protein
MQSMYLANGTPKGLLTILREKWRLGRTKQICVNVIKNDTLHEKSGLSCCAVNLLSNQPES